MARIRLVRHTLISERERHVACIVWLDVLMYYTLCDARVDVLQIFAGSLICAEATFADKVLALFDLFDMDMNKVWGDDGMRGGGDRMHVRCRQTRVRVERRCLDVLIYMCACMYDIALSYVLPSCYPCLVCMSCSAHLS